MARLGRLPNLPPREAATRSNCIVQDRPARPQQAADPVQRPRTERGGVELPRSRLIRGTRSPQRNAACPHATLREPLAEFSRTPTRLLYFTAAPRRKLASEL